MQWRLQNLKTGLHQRALFIRLLYYNLLLNVTMTSQESSVMTKRDMLNSSGKRPLEDKEISDEDLKRKKERHDLEPTSDYNGTCIFLIN